MAQQIQLQQFESQSQLAVVLAGGDSKYPQLICGLKSYLQPLAPRHENAFNPCFVAWLYLFTTAIFTLLCLQQLYKLVLSPKLSGKWYGNLLPRNTGVNHYIRCNSVLVHSALYVALTLTATNIHARYSDFKIVTFVLVSLSLVFVILPLHFIEVAKAPTASSYLLTYWPFLTILQIVLFFQDNFTQWPVLVSQIDQENRQVSALFLTEVFLILNSISIIIYESVLWKPTHNLIYEYNLNGWTEELSEPNLYSKLTYTWMNPIIKQAYVNKTLSSDDLPNISHELSAELSSSKLRDVYYKGKSSSPHKRGSTWHLFRSLVLAFGPVVFLAFLCEMGSSILSFIQPQLLRQLIKFFGDRERVSDGGEAVDADPLLKGILISLGMFAITIVQTSFDNQYVLLILKAGLGCRSSLTSFLYQKSLKLSVESKASNPTGEIVNLVSVDVDRIQQVTQNIQTVVVAPVELILCLISLYYMVGWQPTAASILVLVIMIPLNSTLIRISKRLSKTQMKFKDARSKVINEILTSIKSIKLYSWEDPMNEKLQDIRVNQELTNLRKIRSFNIFGNFIWQIIPFLLSFVTFTTYVMTSDKPLTSEIVFPTLSLLNMISSPLLQFPSTITQLIDSGVSLERIAKFLVATEIEEDVIQRLPKKEVNGDVTVEIVNTSFLWERPVDPSRESEGDDNEDIETRITSVRYALKDINFRARKAQLHCIVGKVGSGKSTFLTSLLGSLEAVNSVDPINDIPFISISGSIAYCAQNPWIMNSTVKDNILFGHQYDEEFYRKTIQCCQLVPDIEVLPDGDETFVGEKGISLSGGQKARLSLARAVYARCDVYLLDDILSAVDSHVGKQIIQNVLSRESGLLKSKTIILATNSLSVLNYSNSIDLLERGQIVESGTFTEILQKEDSNGKLYQLLKEFGKNGPASIQTPNLSTTPSIKEPEGTASEEFDGDSAAENSLTRKATNSSLEEAVLAPYAWKSLSNIYHQAPTPSDDVPSTSTSTTTTPADVIPESTMNVTGTETPLETTINISAADIPKTIEAGEGVEDTTKKALRTAGTVEKSAIGRVKWHVYYEYIKASSIIGAIAWILCLVIASSLSVAADYWLKHWAEQNSSNGSNKYYTRYIGVYAVLGFSSSFLVLARGALLWAFLAIRASRNIHDRMSKSLFAAPMSFFERTPIGRIMNRFTSDINRVDDALPRSFSGFFNALIHTFFTLGVVAVVIPPFILVIIVLSFAYFHYQKYYSSVSRELKRLVSVSRSPIYAHFQESLNGVDTVRAFQQFDRFKYLDDANLDFNLKSLYMLRSSNRWLSSRLRFIGSIAILSTSSLSIFSLLTRSPLSAGTAGFVMTYALQTTSRLSFVVRLSAEVESTIVAFERCLEYSNLPTEQDEDVGQYPKLPPKFPKEGSIRFLDYSTRYRKNLDLILKKVTFDIKGGEKVGVVGRTGAGKSSLTLALFRIIEAVEGSIFIDDVDISKLSVYDLRHHLSIIPQDSQAFEGTLRQNLDPLNEYSDEEIWNVLELAHLKNHIEEIEKHQENKDGLACKVAEGGSNFSAGQLQLMCLARALLNKSKIIVLDEATAAVDVQTDKIIQETIRAHFKDRTIITIAHRLDTVMDSDRIISLDHGVVKEFDSPKNLLTNEEGIFHQLCKQGGYI